ncbi:MAG TPA: hypothetical protein VNI54_08165 [Thermoanaerobaculia bacterium]|nr:hypothetical protein [Thermoanaerobaculia bacterium]
MKNEKEQSKKAYEKPVVRRFPLRPEEAVLGFCKSSASTGPSAFGCRGADQCFTGGS